MKKSDIGFDGFGEAYFSVINKNSIKGWKKHTRMTLNLIVCYGEVKFVIYNDIKKEFYDISLSHKNYQRLTVEPGLWMAFEGMDENNMLLNIANIEHDPNEAITRGIYDISYFKEFK